MEEKGDKKDESENKDKTSQIISDPKLEKIVQATEKPRNKTIIEINKEDLDDR